MLCLDVDAIAHPPQIPYSHLKQFEVSVSESVCFPSRWASRFSVACSRVALAQFFYLSCKTCASHMFCRKEPIFFELRCLTSSCTENAETIGIRHSLRVCQTPITMGISFFRRVLARGARALLLERRSRTSSCTEKAEGMGVSHSLRTRLCTKSLR